MSLPPTKFEDASRVRPLGTHQYGINVHPDFAWGSVAHGGYLFSLLWKAIGEHYRTTLKSYDQPDTVAMHIELLRPVPMGEAVIQIKDVRLGKGSSTLHVALVQGGKERVVGYATWVSLSHDLRLIHFGNANKQQQHQPIQDKRPHNPNGLRPDSSSSTNRLRRTAQ